MEHALDAQGPAPELLVVGIGASAGGIAALQTLFKALPHRQNLAFVIVQHLMPREPSQLASLVGKWTSLPVRGAAEGMKLEQGTVFVAPPGRSLVLHEGVFATPPLEHNGARSIATIDCFFESLAADCGHRAIAVVLSGAGADGAAGAVRVKQAGGMVLVQEPATAVHDSMPRAAIASGAVDHVLPLHALAEELAACASPGYVREESAASWADGVTQALDGIIELIRTRAGFDLAGYKTTPLLWRIQRRMDFRRVSLFRDYEALLHDDPVELETLIRGIPIHVTEFFRDPPVWQALERHAVPRLFEEAGGAAVRAWTPACATGEEAYSVAMLLAEAASARAQPAGFQVFATDAAPEIVARASRGIFSPAAVSALSAERRQRFFYGVDGALRVKRTLRENMVFAPQDLLADPPFTALDVVTCRNLLIYLEPEAAKRVVYLLHSALRLGGYLLLGKAESISPKAGGFEEVAGTGLYRKIGPATRVEFAFPRRPLRLRPSRSSQSTVEAHAHATAAARDELPAAMVDAHFQVLRLYGDAATFLRLKAGTPTLDLMSLMGPGFGIHVEAAAREAVERRAAATVGGLPDPVTGALTTSVRVTPLDTLEQEDARLLVSFIRGPADAGRAGTPLGAPTGPRSREAQEFSEALRVSHEELEASREELQALNEELRASNDQLNLANDELAAANRELRGKLEELETQSNVLSSGAVMTLFVDQELRVRWFTPAMSELFPLLPSDVGRNITNLVQRFEDARFVSDMRAVMQENELREAEVRNVEGKWYLRRIRPYLAQTGSAKGVAVTFADISERKRAEEVTQLRHLLDMRTVGVVFFDFAGGITGANDAFLEMFGFSRAELEAGEIRYEKLTPPEWRWQNEKTIAELRSRGEGGPSEKEYFKKDGSRIWLYCASKMLPNGQAMEFILDVTSRKNSEAALLRSEQRLSRILDTDAVAVVFFNQEGVLLEANAMFTKLTGWTREDVESGTLDWRRMTPPEWLAVSEEQMLRLANTGRIGPYEKEYFRKDGSRAWMLFTGSDMGDGTVVEIAIDLGAREDLPAARPPGIGKRFRNPEDCSVNGTFVAADGAETGSPGTTR